MPAQVPSFLIVAVTEFAVAGLRKKEVNMANFEIEKKRCCLKRWCVLFKRTALRAFLVYGIAAVLEACLLSPALGILTLPFR